MDLEKLYYDLKDKIDSLDFNKIWKDFKPLKFAIYDDDKCFFDGKYIEKTNDFCANTAILYNGEMIAIWYFKEEQDINIFTSKIVHEMFHGYQRINNWNCFANEMEALYNYKYNVDSLSLKLEENKLLLELYEDFDIQKYNKLLEYRKYRSIKYPYEFMYEAMEEEIEGSANFVELASLKALDKNKAQNMINDMKRVLLNPKYFFPIRISCYYTGALMINALIKADEYIYHTEKRPIINTILSKIVCPEKVFYNDNVKSLVMIEFDNFMKETKEIISESIKNEVILEGPYEIVTVNVYDARCYNNYLTSTYFVMFKENNTNQIINTIENI